MNKNSWLKIGIAFGIVVVICAGLIVGAYSSKTNETVNNDLESGDVISGEVSGDIESGEIESGEVEYLGPNIFSGDKRPIAVMIDNEQPAWVNHGGLNSAYMLYEFIIEGGETRIMAFFKNVEPTYIGPVRSARHYFLDYAMEHDAIFVHFGWSPLAQSDIKTLKINNINGIVDTFYWRVAPLSSYHNAITNMTKIAQQIKNKGYRTTSDQDCIISYNQYDTDIENGQTANTINIKYSGTQNVSYKYDADRKVYLRSMIRNTKEHIHKDSQTGEQFYAKNIVMIFVKDELLDDPEDKGRRNLYNVGNGDGFYATNGKIEKITWKKDSRNSRTIYYDKTGNEITFNDGITWVQIVPTNGSVSYE